MNTTTASKGEASGPFDCLGLLLVVSKKDVGVCLPEAQIGRYSRVKYLTERHSSRLCVSYKG